MLAAAPTPVTPALLEERNRARLARAAGLRERIETAGPPFTVDSVIGPLNELQIEVANLQSECGIYVAMHPDKAARDVAERLQREASEFSQAYHQSRPLYDALGAIDGRALGAHERRLVELVRQDMRRSGALLPPAARDRARGLRAELTKLAQDHARNIRDDTRYIALASEEELAGLPADYVAAHGPGKDGVIRISTNPPDYQPFMTYAASGRARRALMTAYLDRAPQNVEILATMTRLRHELAGLLGYTTWAHYNLEERMIGTPEALDRFLDELHAIAKPAADAEAVALLAEKRLDDPSAETLGEWETAYYLNRVKAKRFRFDAQEVRPYLEYARIRQAILDLNSELFGMTFTAVTHEERWHRSVESFDVTIDGRGAGRISLDMHPREGKNKWFFNAPLRTGVAGKQEGHGVLNCNFPDPATVSGPALMEHQQVVTYFHEVGHLVHGLARRDVPYIRLSRVSEGDFMEAPSTFLEEWIYDHSVLVRFAKHVETNAPIPEELVTRLRAARDFGRGLRVMHGISRSRLSLELHDGTRPGADPRVVDAEVSRRYSPFELITGTAHPGCFEHLSSEHYSAAYYTYLWSTVIAKDFHTAFGGDLMDTSVAIRYRDRVLAPGGTKPAAELVHDFLGRPHDLGAFRDWLSAPID